MAEDLASKVSEGRVAVIRVGEELKIEDDQYLAPCTVTLIRAEYKEGVMQGIQSIVDPGFFSDNKNISGRLRTIGVELPGTMDYVFVTHTHPDHMGNVADFFAAKVYTPDSSFKAQNPSKANKFRLWAPEKFYDSPGGSFSEEGFHKHVQLISTPGHSGWDMSVLYFNKDVKIAVVGDLFWSEDDFKNDSQYLGLCVNPEMQKRSRECIRECIKPDVIVPGHGPAFAPKY